MGDRRRAVCKVCGGHRTEVGELSWHGKCEPCFTRLQLSNIAQMESRSGPNWTKWRRSMAACVGGALLDDLRSEP